jgi:histidinol-phosphate/aromatic aminotransferase/cobyric acid decarboxylase-like protein
MYEITTVSALLGEYILNHSERIEAYAADVREGRQWLADFFRKQGFHVPESHANFIHVDFGSKKESIVQALVNNNVLFKESFNHPALSRYCRFTVGPETYMKQFANVFSACTGEAKS